MTPGYVILITEAQTWTFFIPYFQEVHQSPAEIWRKVAPGNSPSHVCVVFENMIVKSTQN